MLSGRIFQMFWIVFIGLIGMLGLTLAMTAGVAFAQHSYATALVATLLTGVCALMCGEAQASLRAVSSGR